MVLSGTVLFVGPTNTQTVNYYKLRKHNSNWCRPVDRVSPLLAAGKKMSPSQVVQIVYSLGLNHLSFDACPSHFPSCMVHVYHDLVCRLLCLSNDLTMPFQINLDAPSSNLSLPAYGEGEFYSTTQLFYVWRFLVTPLQLSPCNNPHTLSFYLQHLDQAYHNNPHRRRLELALQILSRTDLLPCTLNNKSAQTTTR